jgi:hypothetical protein
LSNEEKTNDYEHFEKGMIYMKILKKGGGVVEKRGGGGGNEIHAPCACDLRLLNDLCLHFQHFFPSYIVTAKFYM